MFCRRWQFLGVSEGETLTGGTPASDLLLLPWYPDFLQANIYADTRECRFQDKQCFSCYSIYVVVLGGFLINGGCQDVDCKGLRDGSAMELQW